MPQSSVADPEPPRTAAVPPPAAGLSGPEAAARLERDGPNSVPPAPPTPLWRRLARQIGDPLIVVLLVAAPEISVQ